MTWLDFLLVAIPPALAVLGAERRLMGFALGAIAVLLLRPLVVLGMAWPIVALIAALVLGVVVSVLVRAAMSARRNGSVLQQTVGGVGGFALGTLLVVALVTSLPIQRNPINEREIFYPPRNLPQPLGQAVEGSRLVELGRDILLFPLLDGPIEFSEAERTIYGGLHGYFIVGMPWER